MSCVNTEWCYTAKEILLHGDPAYTRDKAVTEILGKQTSVDMNYPILTQANRELGYKFMFAEAHWILSGDNRVQNIAHYSRMIKDFSDDGVTFFGAYGPKIVSQLGHVVKALQDDDETRQAVINIWRESPPPSKDIPCTISLQFLVRYNQLHIIDTMRSSDIWLGWPYDIFNMSMVARYVLSYLKEIDREVWDQVTLGKLYLNAGSMHLYNTEEQKLAFLLEDGFQPSKSTVKVPIFNNRAECLAYLLGGMAGGRAYFDTEA